MEINEVALIECSNGKENIKFLAASNGSLENLSNEYVLPSENRLPVYDPENIFKTSTRFKIEDLSTDHSFFILRKIYQSFLTLVENREDDDFLQNISDLRDNNSFNPTLIIYGCTIKNDAGQNKTVAFIHEYTKNIFAENLKYFWGTKRKLSDTNVNEIEYKHIEDALVLPLKNPIAKIENYQGVVEGVTLTKTRLIAYQTFKLENALHLRKIEDSYATKKLNRFINDDEEKKYKITKRNISVIFGSTKEEQTRELSAITNIVLENDLLRQSFARFSANGTRTIQKIEVTDLQNLLKKLFEYVDDDTIDSEFESENIPVYDETKNELSVTTNSIPIFSAMLDNKIIQRLLSGEIEIPYYTSLEED
ncbi:hypothetical protein [Leuconostoc mesenteroides]|uniref:hypothetical protein n=1 Tax=Leuconostoc mesenteroides TaxID=1245 RepID=UPI00235E6D06|nr:hypothetical protein [Leuconostoc mesenteroides]